jgi:predicted NBD/HSP70 family sugar kinase
MPRKKPPHKRESPPAGLTGRNLSGTNLQHAGDHNQRVTLYAIRVSGPVTRTDLALMTGLTAAATANITKRLLKQQLILEAGTTRGARGQPATKLVINPDACYSIGLNIDRDHITLVVVDFTGHVRARSSREIKFALPETVRLFFKRSVGRLLAKAGIDPSKLIGIGVAFPDDIQRAGLPEQPPEYAMWGTVAIDRLLSNVLPVPVIVENDAAAAAMGEMQFGLGQQYQSFFYVLITAALGGGLVIDGHYFRGAVGRSGEIGSLQKRNATGETRQLQHVVSLSGLYNSLEAHGHRVSSPRGLLQLDQSGQSIISAWIDTSVDALEDALVAVNCLLNPEAILIGGRLPPAFVDRLASRLNERLGTYELKIPSIAPVARAAIFNDAPAIGAAILPFSQRFLPTRFALMKNVDSTA